MPEAIESWVWALANVNRNITVKEIDSEATGSILPEPALIASPKTEARQSQLLIRYLSLHPLLLYRAITSGSLSKPIRNRTWRVLLGFGWVPENKAESRQAKTQQEIRNLLVDCAERSGITLKEEATTCTTAVWRDTTITIGSLPPPSVVQCILWEMSQVNFRFELVALDAKAHNQTDSNLDEAGRLHALEERFKLIEKVFPQEAECGNAAFFDPSLKCAHLGLAASWWKARKDSLQALVKIMKAWKDAPPYVCHGALQNFRTEQDYIVFEQKICLYYCTTFYLYFGHAANIPYCYKDPTPTVTAAPTAPS